MLLRTICSPLAPGRSLHFEVQSLSYLNRPIMEDIFAVQPQPAPQRPSCTATSSSCSPYKFDHTRWTSTLLSTTQFLFSISSTVCFAPSTHTLGTGPEM